MVEHKPVSLNVHILQSKYIDTELPTLLIYRYRAAHTADPSVLTDALKMSSLFVLFKW
jgi:hypothetical protein